MRIEEIGNATLINADCREVMRSMDENSIDAIVTDPPYGLSFMGKGWDHGVPDKEFWIEALRVAKPGTHLLAFGGTRMFHRLMVAIEDAGWEIRDTIMWVYAQGRPKSGGLKPAHEPITLARKHAKKVVPLQIDLCRVERPVGDRTEYGVDGDEGAPTKHVESERARVAYLPDLRGRYPANLIHDGSAEVVALFPDNNPGCKPHRVTAGAEGVARLQANGWGFGATDKVVGFDDGDNLSAARFFYVPKAPRKDRNEGLDDHGPQFKHGDTLRKIENADKKGNTHPTVKPTELMRYLCRLVTPPGGTVLDPFMGSGSTGKAALKEGFNFVGIELDEENGYFDIACARVKAATIKK